VARGMHYQRQTVALNHICGHNPVFRKRQLRDDSIACIKYLFITVIRGAQGLAYICTGMAPAQAAFPVQPCDLQSTNGAPTDLLMCSRPRLAWSGSKPPCTNRLLPICSTTGWRAKNLLASTSNCLCNYRSAVLLLETSHASAKDQLHGLVPLELLESHAPHVDRDCRAGLPYGL